jgi:hypothetical protein
MGYDYTSSLKQSATFETLMASHPTLLSRDELRREINDQIGVDDALAYLQRVGLVHRIEGPGGEEYFWPTRTAMAAEEAVTAPIDPERAIK